MRNIFGPTKNHMTLCMRDVARRLLSKPILIGDEPIPLPSDAEIDRVIREASGAIRRETYRA